MSNRNILNMSREIENINKNIDKFKKDISNISSIDNKLLDLNEIKMNKLEAISCLEQIRNDFSSLEKKVEKIDNSFKTLLVNKNTEYINNSYLEHLLINKAEISIKKAHILIYAFECNCAQDFFLLNEEELIEFGFTQEELNRINKECRYELESNIYPI